MKTTTSISIDTLTLARAKARTENLSGTIAELLEQWIKTQAEKESDNKVSDLKSKLNVKEAEMAAMRQELEQMRKQAEKNKIVRVIE